MGTTLPDSYRYSGVDGRGASQVCRRQMRPEEVAEHVQKLYDQGWRRMEMWREDDVAAAGTTDNVDQVGGIAPDAWQAGKRFWWSESPSGTFLYETMERGLPPVQ